MMIKLKRLFKQLKEQTKPTTGTIQLTDPKKAEELAKKGLNVSLETEGLVDEASLVNHVHEYRGGVEYVLRDPSTAKQVAAEITQWTERKGFTIVKREITKQGKVGYFYFRMGEDPGTEAQRIQGYISQMPEIKKFRFRVKDQQPKQIKPQQTLPATKQQFN